MDGVEMATPAAVAVPDLMGSEALGGSRAKLSNGFGDAEGGDFRPGSGDATPRIEKSSYLVGQTAGSEEKQLQKKGKRVPRSSPGFFKTPQTPQLDTSMSTSEDVDMKDASDELGSHIVRNSYAENSSLTREKEGTKKKSQQLRHKSNISFKRGDRSSKGLLKTKHDGMGGFSPASGGSKVFGMYGLKPDLHDIVKHVDDIALNDLLDGSYKCPSVVRDKGRKPASTNENILRSVRKVFSILQYQGLPQVDKHVDELDVSLGNETPPLQTPCHIDDEEYCSQSDLSCMKVQESCVNTEAPSDIRDLPVYHPRDIIEKLALSPRKDLDSLLVDAAKPSTFSRFNDPRPGKPVSQRPTLSSFPWSHNYNGHSKSNSDSVKVSSRSSCQTRWVRIGKTSGFLGGDTESTPDLDSLTYDHNLVPSGSVIYVLPEIAKTASIVSSPLVSEQALSSPICSTSSPSPPALHSPRALKAAQALFDIANSSPKKTPNGIIKWPKQPSEKAMTARKSRSIQSSQTLPTPTPKSITISNPNPPKKPKLTILDKKDHFDRANSPRPPNLCSTPRSSRLSPLGEPKDSAPDSSKLQVKDSPPKRSFIAPPRRTTHSQQKPRKVLPMDWNRGKGHL